jgi:mono/diheme cytochrome c family protein
MLADSLFRARCLLPAALALTGLIPMNGRGEEESKPAPDEAAARSQVHAVLTGKCLTCHNPDKKKGGLDLSRRSLALTGGDSGSALVPGKAADSLLFQRVAAGEMPPNQPLTAEQIAAFRRWIDQGATYDREPLTAARAGADWWSLRPVTCPTPPTVHHAAWCRTPIDRFILAKLEASGLRPSAEAERRTLIRRVTFDLTGLPPPPEEIAAFVHDPAPDAYERLVDRLLASPAYGERWGRHWLDVVRFAESHGYETNLLRFNAWPYRDYVIAALNEDKPYPQFILEQLAGDALPGADWLTRTATGFLVGGAHDVVGNATVEGQQQQRMDDLDDVITATAATFLGLTVNCARCHDHKFDPISQKDYYALQAIFAGVQHAERVIEPPDAAERHRRAEALRAELATLDRRLDNLEPLARPDAEAPGRPPVNPRRNVERFAPVAARFVRFTVTATNDKLEPCLDELEIYAADEPDANVALASAGGKATASSVLPNSTIHRIEHLIDGRHGNGRSWISDERGRGWAQVELPRLTRIDRIVWGRDRESKFVDRLPVAYRIEVEAEPGQWHVVASSDDRFPYRSGTTSGEPLALSAERRQEYTALRARREKVREEITALAESVKVYAGTFTQPGPTHLLLRGDPMRKGGVVAPAALSAVRPVLQMDPQAPEKERRLALARWIACPDNPLTARVLVNRVWHYHFGRGLVATPSDFGFNGARPTHPDLLDWLAREFIAGDWRLKPLHRLIVLSATYRQGGQPDAKALTVDRDNLLLWRRPPRRLEAEAVRDAILSASGRLDRRMGGPGYNLWEKNTNYVTVFKPREELGPDTFRRMVYQFKPRSQNDPIFGAFDCPDASLARPRRSVSTTALQALNLLNGRFILAQADCFAERLRRECGDDPEQQVRRAFALTLGREPTAVELSAAAALVREHGAAALSRALYNANEFLYVD